MWLIIASHGALDTSAIAPPPSFLKVLFPILMIPKLTADVRKKNSPPLQKNEKKSRISTDLNFKFWKKVFETQNQKIALKTFGSFVMKSKTSFRSKINLILGFNLSDLPHLKNN